MSKSLDTFVARITSITRRRVLSKEEQIALVQKHIAPETDLEKNIIFQDEFLQGLFWGKPRYGHPEGQIILHIAEVLGNVELIPNLDDGMRQKLRLITILHDTFKYKEQQSRKIKGRTEDNHHAVFATEYAKQFVEDDDVLLVTRLHDEAYYCWKLLRFEQNDAYEDKLTHLLDALGDQLQLFYLFFKCDTQTGDKNQDPLHWFETTINGIDVVEF